jgi:DNA-binding XRE family transcriptional regulator
MKGVETEPTEEERRLVRALSGFGITQDDIAKHVGIDAKTLRKHYRDELDRGSIEATAKVAQSLFQMATTGKNVAAAIFWMKARAQWREKHEVEHSAGRGTTFAVISGVPRADDLSDAELERIVRRGRDDDDEPVAITPPRHRSFVIDQPDRELTQAEWVARYAPAGRRGGGETDDTR